MRKPPTYFLLILLLAAGSTANAAPGQPDPWSRQIDNTWWNQAGNIEALELSEETRKVMDDHAVAFLQSHTDRRNEQSANQRAFLRHAGQGEWDQARERAELVAESTANYALGVRMLKISILRELSDRQRDAMVENLPALINQTWIRTPQRSLLRSVVNKPQPDQGDR